MRCALAINLLSLEIRGYCMGTDIRRSEARIVSVNLNYLAFSNLLQSRANRAPTTNNQHSNKLIFVIPLFCPRSVPLAPCRAPAYGNVLTTAHSRVAPPNFGRLTAVRYSIALNRIILFAIAITTGCSALWHYACFPSTSPRLLWANLAFDSMLETFFGEACKGVYLRLVSYI